MFQNTRHVTIEWGDCDPAGIVFYPRYFAMFDASTAALFAAALGYDKFAMIERFEIVGIPMLDTRAQFRIPSRFGEAITITSAIERFGKSSFDVRHRVFRSGDLAITAEETRVWAAKDPANPERIRGVPIPSEIIEALSASPAN